MTQWTPAPPSWLQCRRHQRAVFHPHLPAIESPFRHLAAVCTVEPGPPSPCCCTPDRTIPYHTVPLYLYSPLGPQLCFKVLCVMCGPLNAALFQGGDNGLLCLTAITAAVTELQSVCVEISRGNNRCRWCRALPLTHCLSCCSCDVKLLSLPLSFSFAHISLNKDNSDTFRFVFCKLQCVCLFQFFLNPLSAKRLCTAAQHPFETEISQSLQNSLTLVF